jgi:hypothetical protein
MPFLGGQGLLGLKGIHVPGNRLDRGDRPEFVEDGKLDNVPRVEDEINVFEYVEDGRGK